MSKNSKVDYTQYVHEFTDESGHTRYAVAEWDEEHNQYVAPLSKNDRKLTGCHSEFAKKLSGLGGYRTRAQALRRARYLFGEMSSEEE